MNADVCDPTHKETRKISESRLMAVRLRRFDVRPRCATIDGWRRRPPAPKWLAETWQNWRGLLWD